MISVIHNKTEGAPQEREESTLGEKIDSVKVQVYERNKEKEGRIPNLKKRKSLKLPKVHSEYYDLIAGQDRKEDRNEKKDDFVGKQIACNELGLEKINVKPDTRKMYKVTKSRPQAAEVEESGDLLRTNVRLEKLPENKVTSGQEHRKRWSKNTLQREALLAIFNESELLDYSFPSKPHVFEQGNSIQCKTVDDMLSINPSEISEVVLEPIQLYKTEPKEKKEKNNYLQLLKHEVEHLREKFELNNRSYQIEDLMRLTDNSKNILKLEGLHKYTEYDGRYNMWEMEESVYHDLECLKMTLEQKIGFCNFSRAYGKMINIINDELDSALKNCLEKHIDLTKTYVVKKVNVAGDNDDLIKNTWKSIIGILSDKQEYLPDVWELAMSENIYYHL